MSTLTIRLPDTKHERLKACARTRGASVNKLVEELRAATSSMHNLCICFPRRATAVSAS